MKPIVNVVIPAFNEENAVGKVIAVVPNPNASANTVPSTYTFLNSKDAVPRSTSLSVIGTRPPSTSLS